MSISGSTSRDSYEYDVFLGYSHEQEAWAHNLAQRLRSDGFRVWSGKEYLQDQEDQIKELVHGAEESRKIVLILSPEFLDSQWSTFKAHIPTFKNPSVRDARLIPLIYTHCNLPMDLVSHQILDFSGTHGDVLRYEFRLAQLMADLDPSRDRPTDFDLFCAGYKYLPLDALPSVGQLPMGSLVPFLPNPNFVGREAELRALYEKLAAGDASSLAPAVALTGMAGIGKTQLVVEFIYRYGRRFSGGVFWLDVSDPDSIPDEIACCAGLEGMNIDGAASLSQDELIATVMREWRGPRRRLLVFDGLENPDIIDTWRPASAGARVLITSRIDSSDNRWAERDVEAIPVDVLPREKSMELLCRGRRDALDNPYESEAANAICGMLGDFPLALHLAGAYLGKYRYEMSLKECVLELHSQPVLASFILLNSTHNPSPTRHQQDISAMFGSIVSKLNQFDEAGGEDTMAAQLLHIISHFAPAPVSREPLIRALKMDESKTRDRRRVADAVIRLCQLGLAQSHSDGRISVHQLLREFMYEHPARDQNVHEVADDVARAMSDLANELNRLEQTERMREELVHLKYIARQSERYGSNITASLYSQLGCYLYSIADLEGARENYTRALEVDEAVLGSNHPTVAIRNNNLGLVLRELNDLTGAKQCYKRALEISKEVLGQNHPDVAVISRNLGRVLYELGDLRGAKEHFTHALQIDEAAHGADHPATARDFNNLGKVEHELGDLQAAKKHFTRALQIDEAAYGLVHPKVATLINNLGKVEHKLGDLEGAKERYARALQIDGEIYGSEHLSVARDAANLGVVLRDIGDRAGAEKRLRWALNILEHHLGTEHPKTQAVRRDLQPLLNADKHETAAE